MGQSSVGSADRSAKCAKCSARPTPLDFWLHLSESADVSLLCLLCLCLHWLHLLHWLRVWLIASPNFHRSELRTPGRCWASLSY
jgi:hypothetical protein